MSKQHDTIFAELRRQEIKDVVNVNGRTTVSELCQRFSVSPATIRNDLNALERQGALKRTHGGAISNVGGAVYELTSQEKEEQNAAQKRAIAKAALAYVRPGDVIAVDTGTTTLEFAELLVEIPNLTIVTNDLMIALSMEKSSDSTVLLLGGSVRKRFHCTMGNSVIEAMEKLRIDTAFVATNGINRERGLSTPSMDVVNIKRKMIEISRKSILLADSSKIGQDALATFAQMSEIDIMITDTGVTSAFLQDAQECGLEVVQAVPVQKR